MQKILTDLHCACPNSCFSNVKFTVDRFWRDFECLFRMSIAEA